MYIAYTKSDGEIIGHNFEKIPETQDQGVLIIEDNFDITRLPLYKVDLNAIELSYKTGQELIDAVDALRSRVRRQLINQYAGAALNPVTLGNLEGATDILVFFMNKWILNDRPSEEEAQTWFSFYTKVAPHFKLNLEDLATEEDALAKAKAIAREVEVLMKNDPKWNVS